MTGKSYSQGSAEASAADNRPFVFRYMKAVMASDLAPVARHVALCTATYADRNGGSVFPGIDRLARDTGWRKSAVKKAMTELKAAGWLEEESRGRFGRASVYRLVVPDAAAPEDAMGHPVAHVQQPPEVLHGPPGDPYMGHETTLHGPPGDPHLSIDQIKDQPIDQSSARERFLRLQKMASEASLVPPPAEISHAPVPDAAEPPDVSRGAAQNGRGLIDPFAQDSPAQVQPVADGSKGTQPTFAEFAKARCAKIGPPYIRDRGPVPEGACWACGRGQAGDPYISLYTVRCRSHNLAGKFRLCVACERLIERYVEIEHGWIVERLEAIAEPERVIPSWTDTAGEGRRDERAAESPGAGPDHEASAADPHAS
jgi:hypothetical protein